MLAKFTAENFIFILFAILLQFISFYNKSKNFRRIGILCQKLKQIIEERESYCIQCEIVAKTFKKLKIKKSPNLVSKVSLIFQNGFNSRVDDLENLEKIDYV